jgi:hypothetical protein
MIRHVAEKVIYRNLVAVPHGGISPRTLSWVKISADSRRRLQFKGAAFCFS